MNDQLALIEPPSEPRLVSREWVIDEHTREVGRWGLALARQALSQAAVRRAA